MAASVWSEARDLLETGLVSLDLRVSATARSQLIHYLEILTTWNTTYNLTAIREPNAMVVRHLLDCLALLPMLDGRRLADVGSGAGLPGLVVAIARPRIEAILIESNRKKAAFLRHANRELRLTNVRIIQERVEQWVPNNGFDIVTARAFAKITDCIRTSEHLLMSNGRFVLMKGVDPVEELADLPPPWRTVENRRVDIPGLNAKRHIVQLDRSVI